MRCIHPVNAFRTDAGQRTLRDTASRLGYEATLELIDRLCRVLEVPLHDMPEMIDDPPKAKRTTKKNASDGSHRHARWA